MLGCSRKAGRSFREKLDKWSLTLCPRYVTTCPRFALLQVSHCFSHKSSCAPRAQGLQSGEYHLQFGVDVRSIRYPGLIGHRSEPGGGTTDYAVEIYHAATAGDAYTCFLRTDQALPMMYMDDAVRGTLELMAAPADQIRVRTSYNLGAMSFTPSEVANGIQQHLPNFQVNYAPDHRQAIAESWPESIDDTAARSDWGWEPRVLLPEMTSIMLDAIGKKTQSAVH